MDDKPTLRAWATARRAILDLPSLSAILRARIVALPEWERARHVLLYAALPNEIDLLPLAAHPEKRFYLPRCAPHRRLAVHPYRPESTALRTSRFGIREPDPATTPEGMPSDLDLVLVPALLLSERGDRLGYGGGYYDRFLPQVDGTAVTIGALPDALILPELPSDAWDVRLDRVVSESRFFDLRGGEG